MTINFSRLIQGVMTWGVWGKNLNTQEMANRISENVSEGVTTFDHADIYGNYTTEAAFGKALLQSGVSRDKIQLISKCGIQLINDERHTYVKHYNYDKAYIISQAEKALEYLKTDYLDLFLLHRPSPLMRVDEIKEAISLLKDQGKIRAFGVSNFTPEQISYLKDDLEIQVNQIQCSLTHYEPFEDDTLFYHMRNDISTMAWSPLGNTIKIEDTSSLKQMLNQLSEKYGCSPTQLVLAWLLHHPANIYPVMGTSQFKRIKEAKESLEIELDIQDWFVLYEASRGKEVA
jgi:predicted oxidoreductase